MTPKALSREIKFRAWNKELKRMIYSDDEHQKTRGWWGVVLLNKEEVGEEIMQFTGLKDRNGKEIYEGDIVKTQHATHSHGCKSAKYKDFSCEVYFGSDGAFRYRWPKDYQGFRFGNVLGRRVEIIGNIYENPELLTKENK